MIVLAYGSGLSRSEIAARLGLADRNSQDADATRAAPSPRPARGVPRERGLPAAKASDEGGRGGRSAVKGRPPTAMSPCQC